PYRDRERAVMLERMPAPGAPVYGTEVEPETELFTINMGPHHPATHGVLRLLLTLEGETVRSLTPIIGYVHTGIEKSCEDQQYWKVIPFVERMDYLSYYFNAQVFCMAVERMLEEEVPPRAQYLRVIHMELGRIASHLFWLGTSALDLGAISLLWYALRDREKILDIFEMSSGQRLHPRYFQVGGVVEDIPPGFEQKVRAFLPDMASRIDQYEAILDRNEILLQRLKHVGQVPLETLLGLGVTGPLLRAAGHPWDLRKALPHHFKLVTEGFRVPPGEVYVAIESPRGELGCFIVADGSAKPARVHMRDPSFVNLQMLRHMAEGRLIADLVAGVAMLDPILG